MSINPSSLPVETLRAPITGWLSLAGTRNAVVRSPTGSGKSTQVPQMLVDHGIAAEGQRVVVLQPRRIAARMLATRVAKERGVRLGDEVGYQVRFENLSSSQTRILFVTEGMMLRHLLEDPSLKKVSSIVIDEFHERHLDGDLCLSWARALQQTTRPDLRIIVMSATIAPEPLMEYLGPCEVFDSVGRTFPVDISYQAPLKDKLGYPEAIWDQAARAAEELVTSRGVEGDLLVFMPGGHEIRRTISALTGRAFTRGMRILPLHGELTPAQQDEVLTPGGSRRIIVSTNVAETSLTIEGVRAVIDSGLARVAAYDHRRGINTLTIQKISKASADQRAGRAGRLGPGMCLRLWPQGEHLHRAESELPEIKRLDLSEALLTLAVVRAKAGLKLDWYEAPGNEALERAWKLLRDLDAVEDGDWSKALPTRTGQLMADFPLHPRFSRMLLTADALGCLPEGALCAALAQGRDILLKPTEQTKRKQEEFYQREDISEFQRLMRAFSAAENLNFDSQACASWGVHGRASYEAARTRDQLLRLMQRQNRTRSTGKDGGVPPTSSLAEALAKSLLSAFPDHLGVETSPGSRVYQLSAGYKGHLEKDALAKAPALLVAAEIAEIQGKALQVKLNYVTRVEEAWLRELFPDAVSTGQYAIYDPPNKRVMNREEVRFHDLVLHSREKGEPNPGLAASILAAEITAGRLEMPSWTQKHDQWITRLNRLAEWMPELELPTIGPEDKQLLIEQMCLGAFAYRQLKERTPDGALNSWLSAYQRDLLDMYAPERLKLVNGRTPKVEYFEQGPPRISVILQHLYDTNETPRIAGGKVPVSVEILAPSQRPVQTTGDLASFWKNSYAAVKTQLKGRYPRHEWR